MINGHVIGRSRDGDILWKSGNGFSENEVSSTVSKLLSAHPYQKYILTEHKLSQLSFHSSREQFDRYQWLDISHRDQKQPHHVQPLISSACRMPQRISKIKMSFWGQIGGQIGGSYIKMSTNSRNG